MRPFLLALLFALACAASRVDVRAQPAPSDEVQQLLRDLERAVQSGVPANYLALLASSADRSRALAFAQFEVVSGATRVVVQERDRETLPGTLPGNGYRLIVDAFLEFGMRARVVTWRLDVKRTDGGFRIADQDESTSVEGLYRLSLNPQTQFDAHDLAIAAEDIDITMPSGTAFIAETDQGVAVLVLLGRGEMRFHPTPETEKGQVKIFCGKETLDSSFDAAFIRMNPSDFESRVPPDHLAKRSAVDQRAFRRATDIFREELPKSFSLDLSDLSREAWSLMPGFGDFLAEIHTRRFGTLTYARSASEAEDITVFDRKKHRNISVYSSAQKIARRGRFYNEDDLVDYDVLDYNIDLNVSPERRFLEGRARLRLRARAAGVGTLMLRLADSLVVQSIVSDRYGRLFGVRVRNQNSIVINLPTALARDSELTVTVAYSGRLDPQTPDRSEAAFQGRSLGSEELQIQAEPSYLYSNRSYWYPQATVTDYATATLRFTVPTMYDVVASGDSVPGSPMLLNGSNPAESAKMYVFNATQPIRYLAFIVSKFVRSDTATIGLNREVAGDGVGLPAMSGTSYDSINVSVEANPRQVQRGHAAASTMAEIVQFYTGLLGDCPYPSFTVALIENDRPGGHSPGYFAALNQPLPMSPFIWRNDPEVFNDYPEFFLAHEMAHQWWGQAVGWRNYHEQWISESFAQYFAALFAKQRRGDDVFDGMLRQFRRWGMDKSDQGPIYLGYRLGHIRGEPRVFSALVYNKGASVLHMLRNLVGDDAFFRGLRRFYRTSRFHKAGTEDFRLAMEAESKRPLDRFFERWIYAATLPKVKFSYRVEGGDVLLHAEQIGNELFDVPVPVALEFENTDKRTRVVIPLSERMVDMRVTIPPNGRLRGIEVLKDETLAEIDR